MTPQEYQQQRDILLTFLRSVEKDRGQWRRMGLGEMDAYAGLAANVLIESVIGPEPKIRIWGLLTRRVKRAEKSVIEMTRLLDYQALGLGHNGLSAFWTMVRQKIQAGEHTQAFCW
jgi:hypothetical protein